MKYFVKISIDGSFPSGVDELGTYQVSNAIHEAIKNFLEEAVELDEAKQI